MKIDPKLFGIYEKITVEAYEGSRYCGQDSVKLIYGHIEVKEDCETLTQEAVNIAYEKLKAKIVEHYTETMAFLDTENLLED